MQTIYEKYASSTHDVWFDTLCASVKSPEIDGIVFPSFPNDQLQIDMVGSCGVHTLYEIKKFYEETHIALANTGFAFSSSTTMLDFGCGFGRIPRFFLKDMPGINIYGVDTVVDFIDICRSTFPEFTIPNTNFLCTSPLPPLPFGENSFDLITAYSVFTHLSEHAANSILNEMHRILKPGGYIVFTLRQKSYLEYCSRLTTQKNLGFYQKIEADSFGNFPERITQYSKGMYIFVPNGSGEYLSSDFYGDTIVPPAYVRKYWCKNFHLCEMFDDINRVSQAFVVFKKN